MGLTLAYGFLVGFVAVVVVAAAAGLISQKYIDRRNEEDEESPQEEESPPADVGNVIVEYEEIEPEEVFVGNPVVETKAQKRFNERQKVLEKLFFASRKVEHKTPDNVCSICLDIVNSENLIFISPICHHAFHLTCIQQWICKSTSWRCPNCNQTLNSQEDEKISSHGNQLSIALA